MTKEPQLTASRLWRTDLRSHYRFRGLLDISSAQLTRGVRVYELMAGATAAAAQPLHKGSWAEDTIGGRVERERVASLS